MKKFLRRISRPLPFVAVVASTLVALFVRRDYFLPIAVLLGAHLLVETVDFFTDSLIKRWKGSKAVQDNLIEIYVDDEVYNTLAECSKITGLPVASFVVCLAESVDIDELILSYPGASE